MDDSLQIQTFERVPSAANFASQIEPRNVPVVFNGCIKDWKAVSCWNPSSGGLDYLQERVGLSTVEAMLSKSAPVFYGDLRSHERVQFPFSAFIDFCKQHLRNTDDGHGVCFESERPMLAGSNTVEDCLLPGDAPQQVYLAQVPIMNIEKEDRAQLEALREDIQIPEFLEKKELASINLWMNCAQTRSSTHYDPHHNLLCVVVALWPPSASPLLYPMPIYGEASNHSSVALENPDFSIHPRAEHSMDNCQKVILYAGDALLIPEGWFHQVDSSDLTVAVNFWWPSNMMSSMLEHMDAYYLRRILRRLVDKEMNQVLHKDSSAGIEKMKQVSLLSTSKETDQGHDLDLKCGNKDLKRNKLKQSTMLDELEPLALQAIHELVSLVHDRVNFSDQRQPVQSTLTDDSATSAKGDYRNNLIADLFRPEDDPVAKIIWVLEPLTLHNVFLAMAHNFPRTLEALILNLLSPVGAEVLTQKFDEMDRQTTGEARNKFYQVFYGVFDDQFTAMDKILNGKESFAFQALKNVLDQYLGVNVEGSKSSVG
ncbi:lysine-specific demethylase JMJ31 isoform X2 [Malania oleifera]|uniref:lysine-specific demethylase JMJ31 isoform X2 n=1 Tax=Malania oleifera TaxID=397392 RepID=UPI0025ADA48E|nr:lysine-specific demethylase JMJ31 isoform X2 [Malania oleifera]